MTIPNKGPPPATLTKFTATYVKEEASPTIIPKKS